jgi:hypothetical protein
VEWIIFPIVLAGVVGAAIFFATPARAQRVRRDGGDDGSAAATAGATGDRRPAHNDAGDGDD